MTSRYTSPRRQASGALIAAAVALAGCAAVPDLGPAPTPAPAGRFATAQSFAAPQAPWPEDRWWARLGDPQLAALVDEALAGSPDLAAADARLRRAQGFAQAAGAALQPALAANLQPGVLKQSYNNGIPREFIPRGLNNVGRATLDLSYEIDFFGRNRAALRAATSEQAAAEVESRAARLSVAAAVAEAYADLARLFAERDVAVATVRIRGETAALERRRVAEGLDTLGEQRQAEAGLSAANAGLAASDEAIALTRNRLAALLGAGPDRGLAITRPLAGAQGSAGLPANLALDLVGRRADIVAARRRAEAAGQRIKVARTDFYPNVNLTAFIGFQSLGLGNLLRSGSTIGQVQPAISLPIFQGGAISGRYAQARADYDEAVAVYDQTLVRALNEVADAAASRRALEVRASETRGAVRAAEAAYRIARQRYEGGLSRFLDVLSAEDTLLGNRRALAELDARARLLDVQLIRALGGGFSA